MRVRPTFVAALSGAALGCLLLAACGSEPEGGTPTATGPDEPIGAAASALAGPQLLMSDGLPPGMKRWRGGGPQQTINPVCNNPHLTYFGGPLLQSPVIVAVFWNSNVNAALQANMGQFYTDVTQSSYWTWLQEYGSVGVTPGSNQAILPGTFGGSFVITPLQCPASTMTNCNLSDAQLQAELIRQIDLAVLPAPTFDCTGNVQTVYMVDFPHNVALSGPQGAGKSCVNNGFCAYHNTGKFGASNTPLIYAALMDQFTGGCATGCGTNATALENSTDTASHELAEAATDPDIGLDTQNVYAAPAGWGDNNNGCGEIGDICDNDGTGDTIVVSGRSWAVQELWSNKQGKCTSTGTPQPVCSGTTLTNCRKCSCGDNGGACTGSTPVCETTSTNVLFGACEQCTASSGTCTGGATCQQSATPAQDDICVGGACVPKTTCPAGDNCGTVPNGCGGTVNCGTCTAPQTCGGGTPSNPNVCGCTPLAACPAGDNCGSVPNGCGGTVNCGTCTAPQTCGGGTPSNPNVCGCTPLAACPAGDNCGSVPNGCGGTVNCGACAAPQTCGGGTPSNPNVCGCTPLAACPAGDDCGSVPNGCGGTVNCGACAAPQTCGGGTPSNPNVCGCTPLSACPAGDDCGTVPDNCGGAVNCGTCVANQVCSGNQCVASGSSSSTGSSSGSTSSSTGTGGTGTSGSGTGGSATGGSGTGGSGTGGSGTGGSGTGGSGTGGSGTGGSGTGGSGTGGSGTGSGTGGSLFGTGGSGAGGLGTGTSSGQAGTGASGTRGTPGQQGGCGCKTAGDPLPAPGTALSAFGMLALAGAMRSRRRRRS